MKRRRIAALLAALLLAVLCGCGGKLSPPVSMDGLREDMLAAAPSLPQMKTVTDGDEHAEKLFAYLSDLDYGKVEHFFLVYSADGLADEIAVIALKDPADAAEARGTLEAHLKSRIQLYTQYSPDQVPRVEDAELFVKDQYLVLIVCDDAAAVKAAFFKAFAKDNH